MGIASAPINTLAGLNDVTVSGDAIIEQEKDHNRKATKQPAEDNEHPYAGCVKSFLIICFLQPRKRCSQ
jgi:hypothetical protein